MPVNPYKNRKGEIVPDAYELDWWEYTEPGKPKKQIKKVVKNTTKAYANQIYRALLQSRPDEPVEHNPTVSDKWHEWVKDYARDNAAGTITDIGYASIHLLHFFGTWRLSQITISLIKQYMDKRALDTWRPPIKNRNPEKTYQPPKPISKRRINTELKYFKLFLDYCIQNNYMQLLPFIMPKFKKLPKRTALIPTIAEVNLLLEKCHLERTRLAILLYHDAGLRRMEALTLVADDIHLDEELIHVIGKGDKERYVAIATTRLRNALEERLEKCGNGLLICKKNGEGFKDLRKAIEAAASRAGISKNIYNHLFRHSYISRSHEAGVPLPEIQDQAGHADIKTTRGYTHVSTRHRIKQAKKLDEHLTNETASYNKRQSDKKQ